MNEILLYIFSGLAFLASTFMIFTRNVLYAALGLVMVLVSVAGIFVLLGAEFVGVAQIMVYVGGIIVLILFAIMFTSMGKDRKLTSKIGQVFPALILAIAVFLTLGMQLYSLAPQTPSTHLEEPVKELGVVMLTDFLVPLELVAVLLLVVLIGSLTIAQDYFKRKGVDS